MREIEAGRREERTAGDDLAGGGGPAGQLDAGQGAGVADGEHAGLALLCQMRGDELLAAAPEAEPLAGLEREVRVRIDEAGGEPGAGKLGRAVDRLRAQPAAGDPLVQRFAAAGKRNAAHMPAITAQVPRSMPRRSVSGRTAARPLVGVEQARARYAGLGDSQKSAIAPRTPPLAPIGKALISMR